MGSFKIEGGYALKGDITPQGAKNEALQVLCAVLLTEEKVTIHNIPDILDVNTASKQMKYIWITYPRLNSHKKAKV